MDAEEVILALAIPFMGRPVGSLTFFAYAKISLGVGWVCGVLFYRNSDDLYSGCIAVALGLRLPLSGIQHRY